MPEVGYIKRRTTWSDDELIAKVQEWVALYDEIPAATDWNPSDARRCARLAAARSTLWLRRAERWETGEYPWPATMQRAFGTWNGGIVAAGFTPRRESMPQLAPIIRPSDAIRSIAGYLRRAEATSDVHERRRLLGRIAERALAAIEATA